VRTGWIPAVAVLWCSSPCIFIPIIAPVIVPIIEPGMFMKLYRTPKIVEKWMQAAVLQLKGIVLIELVWKIS